MTAGSAMPNSTIAAMPVMMVNTRRVFSLAAL